MRTFMNVIVILALLGCAGVRAAEKPTSKPVVERPPKFVTREQWGSEPQPLPDSRKHTPKWVTIHHAGVDYKPGTDPAKFVKNMQGWGQREKNWPDLAYHFLIAPDGRIFEARDLAYEPDSNTKYELQGHIGVEMMGNFEKQRPSPEQLESCARLTAWLCQRFNIDLAHIGGHKDAAKGQTTCPGKDFYRYLEGGDTATFRTWVKRLLDGQDPKIAPGPPLPGGPTVVVGATTQPATGAPR